MAQGFSKNHEDSILEKLGISVINEDEEVFFEEKPVQTEETDNVGMKIGLVERYIKEANRFSLLTPEEEKTLAQIAKNGNGEASKKARQKLITSNLRLVVKIARGFSKYWMRNLIDLIQEGNLGLMKAIGKFDPDRGIKLSYYSSFWIKAYILKFIMDNWKLVKIGTTQAQRKLFYNLKREKEKLLAEGFEVSPQLLADVMDVTEQEVMEMEQRLQGWDLSLEAPVKYDSGESHKDFLPDDTLSPEELVEQADLLAWLRENLFDFRERITKREIFILDQRILSDSPLTLEEIGSSQKISRQRVEQIEKRLRRKFEKFIKEINPMRKGERLTRIMGVTSAQVIRELGIETISQLTSLASDEFVRKLADRKNHAPTVRAIAEGMVKNEKFFAGREKATRDLINYHPSTYKPPTEPLSPDIPAPLNSPAAEPASAIPAAADPTADVPNSFEAILGKYGFILDQLPKEENPSTQFSFARKIKGPDGRTYRFKLEEMRPLPSAE